MATYSPYKGNEGRPAYLRDASFSSYLDTSEREFIRNLHASIDHNQHYSPTRDVSPSRLNMRENRISRNGLDVFGAERYFSEKLDDQRSPIHSRNRGVRSQHKDTRETRDDLVEKSSFKSSNSTQFGGLNLLSGLQYKGACFDKKSVYTNNTTTQKTTQSSKLRKGDKNRNRKSKVSHQEHFSFPIILTNSYNNHLEDNQPRKSLEVFGFHHIAKQDLERQLSILTQHDSFPFPFSFPFPSTKKTSPSSNVDDEHDEYDDARSDASSDLFEIENLSGIPTSQTSYATSEASIECSVTTASAAEFSLISDRSNDEKRSNNCNKKVTIKENVKVQQKSSSSSSSGGGLFGCKGHKSVDVVGSFKNKNSLITKKSNA